MKQLSWLLLTAVLAGCSNPAGGSGAPPVESIKSIGAGMFTDDLSYFLSEDDQDAVYNAFVLNNATWNDYPCLKWDERETVRAATATYRIGTGIAVSGFALVLAVYGRPSFIPQYEYPVVEFYINGTWTAVSTVLADETATDDPAFFMYTLKPDGTLPAGASAMRFTLFPDTTVWSPLYAGGTITGSY